MAMKINELMIGDWVYNKHHKKNIQIQPYDFFVHGHGNNGTFAVSSTIVSGRDLVPIPLTEEILVKNGWDFTKRKYGIYCEEDKFHNVELSRDDDGFYLSINTDEYEILRVDYVHQLQHLLRLCGIEKELIID